MSGNEPQDPDLEEMEAIFDALDAGDPATALVEARRLLAGNPQDPVAHFFAGVALLDLDRPQEAARDLRAAVELDPDDAEFRAQLAYAEFRGCRFDDAFEAADKAVALDSRLPDGHLIRGLVLERRGLLEQADAAFGKAADRDPENFPAPLRLSDAEFETALDEARDFLVEPFHSRLAEVVVTIDDLPSDEILRETDPPLDPELLGLFVGTPLGEAASGQLPPRILIFRRNLERIYPELDALREEIGRTLLHELGHYLGLDEDELDAIDLA